MARKRTKEEAKQRIDDLPSLIPLPRGLRKRAIPLRVIEKGAKAGAKLLIEVDPLDRLADSSTTGIPETPALPVPKPTIQPPSIPEVIPMNREQAIQKVVNDPSIKLNGQDLAIINDDNLVMMDDGRIAQAISFTGAEFVPGNEKETKKKRKRSKYNVELSKQLTKLKRERPRTIVTKLMREAHKRTRKALGMKPKRSKR